MGDMSHIWEHATRMGMAHIWGMCHIWYTYDMWDIRHKWDRYRTKKTRCSKYFGFRISKDETA